MNNNQNISQNNSNPNLRAQDPYTHPLPTTAVQTSFPPQNQGISYSNIVPYFQRQSQNPPLSYIYLQILYITKIHLTIPLRFHHV